LASDRAEAHLDDGFTAVYRWYLTRHVGRAIRHQKSFDDILHPIHLALSMTGKPFPAESAVSLDLSTSVVEEGVTGLTASNYFVDRLGIRAYGSSSLRLRVRT
jgi:hypothetical protein